MRLMGHTKELAELVKKTKQELSNKEEKQIREHIGSVLKILGRDDVVVSFEESIPEMDKDKCDNFYKAKEYIHTLHDVVMLSR